MIISSIGLMAGIVLLIVGGALLVRGASEVAAHAGISPLVVGLTIVGFGTSSPELVINIFGSLRGATEIAYGNVLGSNISNLGLVLGVAGLIAPIAIQSQLVKREIPLLILTITIMTVMALDGVLQGQTPIISRSEGIVLMLLFLIFLYVNALDVAGMRKADPIALEIEENPIIDTTTISRFRWLYIFAGFVLLFIGGELTIRSGVSLAESLGVSATMIGLFVIAVGTSMPELVTSVVAAAKKEPDLALGNVVGSNIFNSLIVLPTSAIIADVEVPRGGVSDLLVSWGLVALLIPFFVFGEAKLGRRSAVMLLFIYVAYVVGRIAFE